MVTLAQAKKIGNKFGIDWKVITPSYFLRAMKVELEHGKMNKLTNLTNDNLEKTAMIVLGHLINDAPDYYDFLKDMEKDMDKSWKGKKKPTIFVKKGKHI